MIVRKLLGGFSIAALALSLALPAVSLTRAADDDDDAKPAKKKAVKKKTADEDDEDATPAKKPAKKKSDDEDDAKAKKDPKAKAKKDDEGDDFGAGRKNKKGKDSAKSSLPDDKETKKAKMLVERKIPKGKGIFVISFLEINYERALDNVGGGGQPQPGAGKNRVRNDSSVKGDGYNDNWNNQPGRNSLPAPRGYTAVPNYEYKTFKDRDEAVTRCTEFLAEFATKAAIKSGPKKSSRAGKGKSAFADTQAEDPPPLRKFEVKVFKDGEAGEKQAEEYVEHLEKQHGPSKKKRPG